MNKNILARYIIKKSKSQKSQKQLRLLEDIEESRKKLENFREYFNSVKDPNLVDYAIYMEEAAKAKYVYLLNKARKSGLRVDNSSVLRKLNIG